MFYTWRDSCVRETRFSWKIAHGICHGSDECITPSSCLCANVNGNQPEARNLHCSMLRTVWLREMWYTIGLYPKIESVHLLQDRQLQTPTAEYSRNDSTVRCVQPFGLRFRFWEQQNRYRGVGMCMQGVKHSDHAEKDPEGPH